MQAILQPYFLKNINVECRFKMLLSPNENQMFPEAHEGQERTFCRIQAALDWFPRPVWSHPPRCFTVLILFTWAELPFHVMQEENPWEESGHTVWKAAACVVRQGGWPCQWPQNSKNYFRCLHTTGKTNTRTFRCCPDAENKIWGVHVDCSSAPRTSFNMKCINGFQIQTLI